ncbi:DUF1656 domain-containing protein [Pseudomonas gingeri]|uniref:DUF1656 domain-containing protein n=1 Tax=Pseudomonas gingeri TaxID=117681 RepID=A0A7Y7X9G0_9PSED|nr:DUF1656 domain-containing protein [Pseudomonas gingeri]NWA29757.1 DUF1656 domain-containing protein [Pseudomonas gingeri]NWB95759.1 DUF1656 domain-containing protein [Pseudomonas gingeri]
MNEDWNIDGVFLHSALVAALLAAFLHFTVRWLLARTHAYAWMWHPGLADIAIFVILWAGVVAVSPQ